jgi:hypothetical protein
MGMVKRESLRKYSAVTFCRKKYLTCRVAHVRKFWGLASKEVRQIGGRSRQICCRQILRQLLKFGTMNHIKETYNSAAFLKQWSPESLDDTEEAANIELN